MSLKRRNLIALLLLFLASVGWVYGMGILDGRYDELIEPTTAITVPATTTYTNTVIPEQWIESSLSQSTSVIVDEIPPRQTAPTPRSTPRIYGFLLVFLALGCGGGGLLIFSPIAPSCGLDGVCILLSVLYLIRHGGTYISDSDLYYIFALFLVLAGIREFWGWWRVRFSLAYCSVCKVAKACTLPQISLLIYVLWILLPAVCLVRCLAVHSHNFTDYLSHSISNIPAVFLGFRCLWRYGGDLEHFQAQLNNYRKGLPISVGEGAFAQTEAQLLEVQAQHEEAIRTAVTSERFKVELISNVSHDLRTPLTSILGYSELLQKEELSPEGKDQLQRLYQKAEYMNELVDSLFELTKVSSGVVECKKESLDLIRLLEQTIGLFDDQLSDAGLVVRRSYAADTIPIVTDGGRMHRVFANLLGNAIKYAMPGTRIYLEVKEHADRYSVRMTNTASYEMDFQAHEILQRFVRGDKARSTKGSGIGLAIAQTYTESVGGSFHVNIDGDQFSAVAELPKNERNL